MHDGSGFDAGYDMMQFTGLKDTDGREIYENDIVLIDDHGEYFPTKYNEDTDEFEPTGKYQIVWSDDGACFAIHAVGSTPPYAGEVSPFHDYAVLKVLGNIYENPELLKV